jgi:CubicO group peptidase (beta-lactamase class C family)
LRQLSRQFTEQHLPLDQTAICDRGAAIESAAGEVFLSYMQRSVFKPLGPTSTVADEPAQIIEQRARFYTATRGSRSRMQPSPTTATSGLAAAFSRRPRTWFDSVLPSCSPAF